MLITRTPFRISFFGGGTDFYDYFSKHGGCVLSTTIDKYCYVTVRHLPPFFDYKNQITYSKIERFSNPDELQHPLVRAALKYIPTDRIQIAYDADLPACSGIGSSSAFAVGLVQSLNALKGVYPDKMTLAKEAIHLERVMCSEAGGVQDQIAASFGGFNRISFDANGYNVTPIDITEQTKTQLRDNLLLAFTGFTHFAGEISVVQQNNIPKTISQLDEMKSLVTEAENILISGKTDDFGLLLDHTWRLKRTLSDSISNSDIDELYKKSKENGALGGKLLGAGGGGFLLLYVPQEKQNEFKEKMNMLKFVPFDFENTGTSIIFNNDKNN